MHSTGTRHERAPTCAQRAGRREREGGREREREGGRGRERKGGRNGVGRGKAKERGGERGRKGKRGERRQRTRNKRTMRSILREGAAWIKPEDDATRRILRNMEVSAWVRSNMLVHFARKG